MWRKEEGKIKSSSDASTSSVSSVQSGTSVPQSPPSTPAAVNQGIKITGEISGQGDFFLDGELEGKVSLPGGTFTVGPNARVNAEIEARAVIIRGEVIGALRHCERVHILSTGKLTGDMETRGIMIEDGAVLHSKVAVPQAGIPGTEMSPSESQTTQHDAGEPVPRAKGTSA